MILLSLLISWFSHGTEPTSLPLLVKAWRHECEMILGMADHLESDLAHEAEHAAHSYILNAFPVNDHEIGRTQYLYKLSDVVPSQAWVRCERDGKCEMRMHLAVAPLTGSSLTANRDLSIGDLTVQLSPSLLDVALPGAIIHQSAITHAGATVDKHVIVNAAWLAGTSDQLKLRIGFRDLIELKEDGTLPSPIAFRRLVRFEVIAKKLTRDQLKSATKALLGLTSPSVKDLELSVGSTENGYIVGFKQNPVLGTMLRYIVINRVAEDRFSFDYFN